MKEALLLNSLNHKNLLKLHGICIDSQKSIKYIILEYMNMGDLLNFLRMSRSTQVLLI
jgi:serine/threonine protein kinase